MVAKQRVALITGVTGQDGAYLARTLLRHGYVVHGTSRSPSPGRTARLSALGVRDRITLHDVDLLDVASLRECLTAAPFTHVFHLAAPSSVARSFDDPAGVVTSITIGMDVLLRLLEQDLPSARLINAASGECFGNVEEPADETSPFCPRSPYAVAKASAHWLVGRSRSRGHHFSSAILFNHELPLRAPEYAIRKIVAGVVAIHRGEADRLELGNLEVVRDWGWAPEYAEALRLIGERDAPGDLVVATGRATSLKDLMIATFDHFDLDWSAHVRISSDLLRPSDIEFSVGNPARIERELGWKAERTGKPLIEGLIEAELAGTA